MTWEVTAQATAEPVTVEEVKTFLAVTSNDHDSMLALLIQAAREAIEAKTGLRLLSQTVKQYWDEWPTKYDGLTLVPQSWELGLAPVSSVTSIQYIDKDGVTQTWATTNYTADVKSRPARIVATDSVDYPELDDAPNAVIATYVVGFSNVASVPAKLKMAIMQTAAFLYENREDMPIGGVGAAYRVRSADAIAFTERLHLI